MLARKYHICLPFSRRALFLPLPPSAFRSCSALLVNSKRRQPQQTFKTIIFPHEYNSDLSLPKAWHVAATAATEPAAEVVFHKHARVSQMLVWCMRARVCVCVCVFLLYYVMVDNRERMRWNAAYKIYTCGLYTCVPSAHEHDSRPSCRVLIYGLVLMCCAPCTNSMECGALHAFCGVHQCMHVDG